MPDYAGACDAIEEFFKAAWAATTPIAVPNPTKKEDIVKTDAGGQDKPWVFIEVEDAGSVQHGIGIPGDQLWRYDGIIAVHVFVPVDTGRKRARELAVAAGEIFRAKRFYRDVPGFEVRTMAPRVDSGGSGSEDGQWYRTSATIPFTYWHRG